ncbi:hypothetical protein ES705_07201 [subsurface metagenome]
MGITQDKLTEFMEDRVAYTMGKLYYRPGKKTGSSGVLDSANEKYLEAINKALKPYTSIDPKNRPRGEGEEETSPGELKFVDDKGVEHRAYRLGEKLADPLTEGLREDSFGRILIAGIIGDKSGLSYEEKSLSEGTGESGGFLISDVVSKRVWDEARNKSCCLQAGVIVFPMDGPIVRLIRVTGSPAAYFVAENEEITEGNFTIAPVTLKAMTVGCYIKSSIELLSDAPNAAAVIQKAMSESIALKIDLSVLTGDGVNAPRGISNSDGRNIISMGVNGAAPTSYDEFSNGVQDILENNGEPNAVIYSPRTYGTLDRLKETTTANPLTPPQSFQDLKKFSTNQVGITDKKGSSSIASKAYIGDFRQILLGVRSGLKIETARSGDSTFKKNQIRIRAISRIDIAIMNEAFFTTIEGIIP